MKKVDLVLVSILFAIAIIFVCYCLWTSDERLFQSFIALGGTAVILFQKIKNKSWGKILICSMTALSDMCPIKILRNNK